MLSSSQAVREVMTPGTLKGVCSGEVRHGRPRTQVAQQAPLQAGALAGPARCSLCWEVLQGLRKVRFQRLL